MIELIINSTPYDSFSKDLLGKPICYTTAETLQEGIKYEAITAGNAQFQKMAKVTEEVHAVRTHERKCRNCGTIHKPRQGPAYRDACGANLHVKREPSDSGTRRRTNSSQRYKHGKHTQRNRTGWKNKDVHLLERDYETDCEF